MKGIPVLFGLMLAACLVGVFDNRSQVRATEPDPCDQYECKVIHAFWDAWYKDSYAVAYYKADTTDTTDDAEASIYTQSSSVSLPRYVPDPDIGERETWVFPKCSPMCGKSENTNKQMAWQSRQEVVRLGEGGLSKGDRLYRRRCTMEDSGKGKKIDPAVNDNTNLYSPPQ